MICPNCGKENPTQMFCAYCGAELIDPKTVFNGTTFSTIEECEEKKSSFQNLTKKYFPDKQNITVQNIQEARKACTTLRDSDPILYKWFSEYLDPIDQEVTAKYKEKSIKVIKQLCGSVILAINVIYLLAVLLFLLMTKCFTILGKNLSFLNILPYVWTGGPDAYTWFFNVIVVLAIVVAFFFSVMVAFGAYISRYDIAPSAASIIGILTSFLFGIIWIVIYAFRFFDLQYSCNSSFAFVIVGGIVTSGITFVIGVCGGAVITSKR